MIYLDHNATSIIIPEVKRKMDELSSLPLNASSLHAYGRKGKAIIENSRKNIANMLGFLDNIRDYNIVFTSSGTEANNLLINNFLTNSDIFISETEHKSILIYKEIYPEINIIKVQKNGLLDINDLEKKLKNSKKNKKIVSVALANNETGVIQPIKEIAKISHQYGALIHTDAIQAIGKIELNLEDLNVDFMSISGHKFGAPQGAAALIHKISIPMKASIIGGGQEKGLRSGTENIIAIAGMGEAANFIKENIKNNISYMIKLRNKLENKLKEKFKDIKIAGENVDRLPNTSLIINPLKDASLQLISLDLKNIAVSSGSACSSGKVGKSHVLTAMDYPENELKSAIRISNSYTTTEQEIDNFLEAYEKINNYEVA